MEQAKEQARKEGVTANVEFSTVSASDESIGNDYDLITCLIVYMILVIL